MSYTPMQLASAFIKTGELADALDALNAHLTDNPADDAALRLRAGVLLRLGDDHLPAVIADLRAITQPDVDDAVTLSVAYARLGDGTAAVTSIESAVRQYPHDERLAERLLQLYLQQRRIADALTLIRQQPRVWRWLIHEGDVLVMQGDDTLATARYGLALAQLNEHRQQIASAALTAIYAQVLLSRAHAYRRSGLLEQADADYAASAELMPDEPTTAFNRGVILALQGDVNGAVVVCQPVLDQVSEVVRAGLIDDLAAPELTELRERLRL